MTPKAGKCHIRIVEESNYPRLEEIYRGHEGKSLPVGYFEDFRNAIRSDEVIYLIADVDGEIVGGGGISDYIPGSQAVLTFGVVAAEHCGMGYGTAIILARLLLIDPGSEGCQIALEATEWSAGFFTHLGFKWYGSDEDELGNRFIHGSHMVYPNDRLVFSGILERDGVSLDRELEDEIQGKQAHGERRVTRTECE